MPGFVLDRVASVWRLTNNPTGPAGQKLRQVYPGIRCAIVPISSFATEMQYARESTHVIFVPRWLVLAQDDEVRYGRRDPDVHGNVLPEIYTVNNKRRFSQSVSELSFYAKEKM